MASEKENEVTAKDEIEGLFLSAEHGRADVIKAIFETGQVNVDSLRNETGMTPLHVAAAYDKIDAVRTLLALGLPIDAQDNVNKQSAYQLAISKGHQRVVQAFHQFAIQEIAVGVVDSVERAIQAGIQVDTGDGSPQNNSLLHWAAFCGSDDVVSLLCELGATVDLMNQDGATPLHEAAYNNRYKSVEVLLNHGALGTIKGKKNYSKDKTAFDVARSDEIRELIEKKNRNMVYPTQTQQPIHNTNHNKIPILQQHPHPTNVKQDDFQLTEHDVVDMVPLTGKKTMEKTMEDSRERGLQKMNVQLEEKDELVLHLKSTIETLLAEKEEMESLQEDKCVLEFIRKLKLDITVANEKLRKAEEYIRFMEVRVVDKQNELDYYIHRSKGLEKEVEVLVKELQSVPKNGSKMQLATIDDVSRVNSEKDNLPLPTIDTVRVNSKKEEPIPDKKDLPIDLTPYLNTDIKGKIRDLEEELGFWNAIWSLIWPFGDTIRETNDSSNDSLLVV